MTFPRGHAGADGDCERQRFCNYQWRKNGEALRWPPASSCAFLGPRDHRRNVMNVVVSNAAGSVTSTGAAVVVTSVAAPDPATDADVRPAQSADQVVLRGGGGCTCTVGPTNQRRSLAIGMSTMGLALLFLHRRKAPPRGVAAVIVAGAGLLATNASLRSRTGARTRPLQSFARRQ